MKTTDEIRKLGGNEYINEVSKIILFGNDNEIKDFIKWTKPELWSFYEDWSRYDKYNDVLTMKWTKPEMRSIVGGVLHNMVRQVVSDNVGIPSYKITREDVLDYLTTIRREIIINELIN